MFLMYLTYLLFCFYFLIVYKFCRSKQQTNQTLVKNLQIVVCHFFLYSLTEAFRKVVQHREILLSTEAVSRQINFAVLLQPQLPAVQHSDVPVQLLWQTL